MIANKLKQLLIEHGYPTKENAQSLITTCLACGKTKHLYIFLQSGWGKCMRCGTSFSPKGIVVQLKGCTYDEAAHILGAADIPQGGTRLKLPDFNTPNQKNTKLEEAPEIIMPYNFFPLIERLDFKDAWKYLINRGIMPETVCKYDLRYSPDMRRIIIPIYMDGKCYGWQGRDITGKDKYPYMSPFGFKRAKILMGWHKLDLKLDYIILSEGPFDFLKLTILGNAVASMGKIVTIDQIKLIKTLPINRVYLALDPDACGLFDEILYQLEPQKEVYLLIPPNDKKDFGECNKDEIIMAFKDAKRYTKGCFLSSNIFKI